MSGKPRVSDGLLGFLAVTVAAVITMSIFAALLSWIGVPGGFIVLLFVIVVFAVTTLRSIRPPDMGDAASFRDPGPGVTPRINGLTVGIEWLSAFGLFGIVGAFFAFGHDGIAILLGLAAGFVVSAVLIVPRLQRMPSRSLPDFLSLRYGSSLIRWAALGVMAVVSVLFISVQLLACGMIAEHGVGIPYWFGVLAGAGGMLLMTLPGGLRSLTAAQILLAAAAAVGLLVAAVWMLTAKTGIVVPQLAWGGLLADVAAAEERLGLEAQTGTPFAMLGVTDFLLLMISLAVGSAVMPVFLDRVSAGGGSGDATRSLLQGLIIFVILATALPALAVLARAELLGFFTVEQGEIAFSALANDDFVSQGASICGARISGAGAIESVRAACEALGYAKGFPAEEVVIEPQDVLFALPALTGAGVWVLALLALTALAVALAAGGGAALSFAHAATSRYSALDAGQKGRSVLVAIVSIAVLFALGTGLDILTLGAWVFSLAGAALFAPVALGLWWPRATRDGALAGLIVGFAVTAFYIIGASWGFDLTAESGDEWIWLGLPPIAAGAFGALVSLFLTFWVSLATDPPRQREQERVEALLRPKPIASLEAPE